VLKTGFVIYLSLSQFETLRLFPPVPTIPKWALKEQQLSVNGTAYTLPPGTMVNIEASGLHYSERYWGPDADEFNPQRWDTENPFSFISTKQEVPSAPLPKHNNPPLNKPLKGAWVPFSEGSRACMARRFAQTEFVAVITVLLSKFTIGLKLRDAETEAEGRTRLQRTIAGSTNQNGLRPREGFEITLTPLG
jgi:cytochrome P450